MSRKHFGELRSTVEIGYLLSSPEIVIDIDFLSVGEACDQADESELSYLDIAAAEEACPVACDLSTPRPGEKREPGEPGDSLAERSQEARGGRGHRPDEGIVD